MPRTTNRSARRAGFTMVEMLVVLTIISILITLTAAAVLKLIPAQQQLNTQSTLTRLEGDLQRAYRSAADKFRTESIPTATNAPAAPTLGNVYYGAGGVLAIAGGDPNRAQVIWTKLRLKQTFPNSFAEALSPVPMPPLSYYTTKLTALGYTSAAPQPWESSVCLLWALQRGESGTAIKESDFGTGSLKDFVLPNGQTVKGLVDDWGMPLYFCRWPVFSTQVNPPVPPNPAILVGVPQSGNRNDADDPIGLLESTAWRTSGTPAGFNLNQFLNWCHPLAPPTAAGEPQTFRVYPLIVSAGADRVLGLNPNNYFATLSTTAAADNIYPKLASPK
jgi:prepilin-type N-terminal cleavage/methylation domain-containing protein